MSELRFSLLDESPDALLSVSVLEVVRHHPPPLLVGGVQRELQLSLVELLPQTDDPPGLAGDGPADPLYLGLQVLLLHQPGDQAGVEGQLG